MKPTTTRERVLLILLPALLIVAVYGWLVYPRGELDRAQKGLEAARAKEPSLADFAEKQVRLRQLDGQLEEAEQRNSALQARRHTVLNQRTAGSANQLSAIDDLTSLLVAHNLHLIEEGPAEGKLPGPLEEAAARLSGDSKKPRPGATLWRLRFQARYGDVLNVVQYLAQTQHQAIPVHLAMEEVRGGTDWRVWTLVVWI